MTNSSSFAVRITTLFILCGGLLYSQSSKYHEISEGNDFIIVIDKSGSMSGSAISDTKKGALNFLSNMKQNDKASLVSFSDQISMDVPLTSDMSQLKRGVNRVSVSGATKLYDALASSVKHLLSSSGSRIIVYLTDGKDTGSNFSLDNLHSMFQGENVFVYGIGLGNSVNVEGLKKISNATGGDFHTVSSSNSSNLGNLYSDVLSSFYKNHAEVKPVKGDLIVRSIPTKKVVRVNGENKGVTPLKLTNLDPGSSEVEVYFDQKKMWKETIEVKAGYTLSIQARERDATKNLWIISRPHQASVFFDGEYVGYTSSTMVNTKKRSWHKTVSKDPKELQIIGLRPGIHSIEIIGFPDFDYGPEQKVTFDYLLEGDDVLFVDIFRNLVRNKDGDELSGDKRADPFEF